jgi:hypothetical protein
MTEVPTDDRIAAVTPLPIDTSREQGLAGGLRHELTTYRLRVQSGPASALTSIGDWATA